MHAIQLLINISYNLFLIPYKIPQQSSKFIHVLHTLVTLTFSLLGIIAFSHIVYIHLPASINSPLAYLEILGNLVAILTRAFEYKLIWFQKHHVIKLLENISYQPVNLVMTKPAPNYKFMFLATATLLISVTLGIALELFAEFANVSFNQVATVIQFLGTVNATLLAAFGYLLTLLSAHALRTSVKSFLNFLKLTNELYQTKRKAFLWHTIENWVEWLEEVTVNVNRIVGSLITCNIMSVVIYFAIQFDKVATMKLANGNLAFIFYMSSVAVYFYVCADIPCKMGELKDWLNKKRNMELVNSSNQFYMLINKIDSKFVSVKASGLFPITYSLLISVSKV